ncbi:Chemotaxis protein methyltransferase CheR [Lysobacter dokdonensis DS-58]|uniref:histidine kinase n=1 Tax=Lysobacter dokdonensis DS-58 TaxID=1300345 RepID=A0A0A2X258_9GAMM|nr:PAS domain-containing sensor histidine kinase [Lysobacter dokdonensis]KGQ19314.1 Chemotaxis protein methyltransferase CheR [Lysobacter dokdonensis DS-58]
MQRDDDRRLDIAQPGDGQRLDDLRGIAWRFLRTTPMHAALVIEVDGTIDWANDAAYHIFGDMELVGRQLATCFVPEDQAGGVPEFETDVARATGFMENDRWMRRADDSRFWAEGATVALRDDGGELLGYLKILRNRTTHKMATEMLRNQVTQSEAQAAHCEGAMITLAHELRNPLATMMACADLLDRLPPDDTRIDSTRAMLRRSLGYAARMVDDLVDSTRAATGRLSLRTEPLEAGDMLQAAIATAKERAPARAPRVSLILPAAPVMMEADPLRMQQVFVNLVGNAIRYTPEDGRIWVTAVQQGEQILVKIEDTGIGMTSEVLDHIFEMFSQARETSSQGGLGIGLTLVKQMVQMHGGSVTAQSDGPGKGSKFIVTLPMRQVEDAAPVTES